MIVSAAARPASTARRPSRTRGLRVAVVERELVGGECSYWACIPSKSLLAPGEAVHGAREAGASAQVDVQAALAWRDFMVSNYSDAGQERWLADRGIDLLRGSRPARRAPAWSRSTASGTPLSTSWWRTGSDPVVPPVPGPGELDGRLGHPGGDGMKAVPRRLLVLGGGSAGVELAQVVRRLGGEVVLVEGADRVIPREPAPLGEALGEALRRDGIELALGVTRSRARRDGDDYRPGARRRHARCEATDCWCRPVAARASRGSGWRRVGVEADPHGIRVDEYLRAGERLWAIGDVNGIWPLTHVGEYEGDVVAANILGETRPANYEAVPRVTYTDPQAAAVGAAEAPYSATARVSEVPRPPPTRTPTPNRTGS